MYNVYVTHLQNTCHMTCIYAHIVFGYIVMYVHTSHIEMYVEYDRMHVACGSCDRVFTVDSIPGVGKMIRIFTGLILVETVPLIFPKKSSPIFEWVNGPQR